MKLIPRELIISGLIFFVGLAFLSSFLLLSPSYLVGDEVYYYFQADHIRAGQFVWFSQTQPPLYPLLLSLLPADNVALARFLSVVLFALAGFLLYRLITDFFSQKAAIVAWLLFITHPKVILYGTLIFNEALTIFLFFCTLYSFLKIVQVKKDDWRWYLAWGTCAGLMVLTKIAAFVFLPVMIGYLLYVRLAARRPVSWLYLFNFTALVFLIFLPHLILGAWGFIMTKLTPFGPINRGIHADVAVGFIDPFLFFAFILVLFFGLKKPIEYFFTALVLFFSLVLLYANSYFFDRHFLIIVPAIIALVSLKFCWPIEHRVARGVLYCLLVLYFVNIPGRAVGVDEISANHYFFSRNDCQIITQFYASCTDAVVTLPYFVDQSPKTCVYSTEVITQIPYSRLIINYPDDGTLVTLSGARYSHDDTFTPAEFNINLPPGKNQLNITTSNFSNIGGLGQVLLCR